MAAATYATKDEVLPLLGNLRDQFDDAFISEAISSSTSDVNLALGLSANIDEDDSILPTIKRITRFLTAAELLTGVANQEDTVEQLTKRADRLIDKIIANEQTEAIGSQSTESSEAYTWPMNQNGEIYSVDRWPGGALRRIPSAGGGDRDIVDADQNSTSSYY